jgi:hypothetical protein
MTSSQPSKPAAKLPTHHAYHVLERNGKDAIWTRVGSAWAHNDGKGFNIQLHVAPLDGRITLRLPSEDK